MRILVIEDEALVALETEMNLTSAGHEVIGIADTLRDALMLAEKLPALALVDIQLAEGESGFTVAAALKKLGIPTLFATGNCPLGEGSEFAVACLHKPFGQRDLLFAVDAVNAVLHGGQKPSPRQALHFY